MARTYFYATPKDQLLFREYIDSIGLKVYPYQSDVFGRWEPTKKQEVGGYIAFQETNTFNLHKHVHDKFLRRSISHASDPLIWWTQSYIMTHENDNYIIQGTIEYLIPYKTNREEEYKKGQMYFNKLVRWIRKNWPPRQKRGMAIGEEAQKLVQYEGYLARGLPPSIEIQYIKI